MDLVGLLVERAITEANTHIVAVNARLQPADRLPLIDVAEAVATWRRARPARPPG